MRKILIDRNVTNPGECSYGFPWKHDTICYNFRTPDEVIRVNEIENIVDKSNIETLIVGCNLTDFDFITGMINLRQLYIYSGNGITNLLFLENLYKLQQLYIADSHIQNMEELVQLMKNKKACVDNEVDLWKKIDYGMEGIYISSDRYSKDGTELLAPGLYVSEIIVNRKHLRR
jgi:hypothetical protein